MDKTGQLFQRQAQQWSRLGQTAPYWSVFSGCPRTTTIERDDFEEFYRSGDEEIGLMREFFRRAECVLPSGVCIDWECGLGRVTHHLAHSFQHVIGLDISADHLHLARQNIARLRYHSMGQEMRGRIDFIQLTHAKMELSRWYGDIDFIHSILVLQHMPPPLIRDTLVQFVRLLKPGGIAFFQIPTYKKDYNYQVYNHEHGQEFDLHILSQQEIRQLFVRRGCVPLAIFNKDRVGQGYLSQYFLFQKQSPN